MSVYTFSKDALNVDRHKTAVMPEAVRSGVVGFISRRTFPLNADNLSFTGSKHLTEMTET